MPILHEKDPLYQTLMSTEGKAEIINGEIIEFESAGYLPNYAATRIRMSLRDYEQQTGAGESLGGFVGFLCDLPNRQSFCADAAFYTGAEPENPMVFLPEPPIFAAEVRNLEDYGSLAETLIKAKINDYFAAGTLVVWDVDLRNEDVIAKFTAPDADNPQIFGRGDIADAGAAVPNWTIAVATLFPR